MGLMGQWDLLLLDEVTVDLDVLVRSELLKFLQEESDTRGATIICKSLPDFFLLPVALTRWLASLFYRRDTYL